MKLKIALHQLVTLHLLTLSILYFFFMLSITVIQIVEKYIVIHLGVNKITEL